MAVARPVSLFGGGGPCSRAGGAGRVEALERLDKLVDPAERNLDGAEAGIEGIQAGVHVPQIGPNIPQIGPNIPQVGANIAGQGDHDGDHGHRGPHDAREDRDYARFPTQPTSCRWSHSQSITVDSGAPASRPERGHRSRSKR